MRVLRTQKTINIILTNTGTFDLNPMSAIDIQMYVPSLCREARQTTMSTCFPAAVVLRCPGVGLIKIEAPWMSLNTDASWSHHEFDCSPSKFYQSSCLSPLPRTISTAWCIQAMTSLVQWEGLVRPRLSATKGTSYNQSSVNAVHYKPPNHRENELDWHKAIAKSFKKFESPLARRPDGI